MVALKVRADMFPRAYVTFFAPRTFVHAEKDRGRFVVKEKEDSKFK